MNNAKMWLVVPPAVGVPVFLGAVAVGSFSVHVAVLSNTSWVSDFLSGQELGTGDQQAALKALGDTQTAKVGYAIEQPDGAREVTVVLPDGEVVRAVVKADELHAAASPPLIASQ